jgi:deferrochelatase/peroxidase EfeB
VASAAAGVVSARSASAAAPPFCHDVVPFRGEYQVCITTAAQDRLHMVAFDVVTEVARRARRAADRVDRGGRERMTAGRDAGPVGAVDGIPERHRTTRARRSVSPARLTLTFGIGPSLFRDADPRPLRSGRPASGGARGAPGVRRRPASTRNGGGDLCIQACADDAQVAVHAVRNLVRLAFGVAAVRWSQMGYGKSSSTTHDEPTPRNLFGFKDGTANITGDDASGLDDFVWAGPSDGPAWMAGGTYLAVRKIRMTIETWDRTSLREQEGVFGRTKREGAPLSGGDEFTPPDFAATGREGEPLVPVDSHVALAHASNQGGNRILRRAYNYTDGSDRLGRLDAGLFFLAYQRDIEAQFVPMQTALSKSDRMNEYVRYLSSATFAIPPGVRGADGYLGEGLFA